MKSSLLPVLLLVSLLSYGQTYTLTAPPNGDNHKSSVTQWIGLASVTITYRGPDVHSPTGDDRTGHIWGELVHYGLKDPDNYGTSEAQPWRAGANEITTLSLSHDVLINGKELKAGTYGVFILLEENKPWTWIFSRSTTSWGSYHYNPKDDALRVEATPQDCAYTEWLTYGFENRGLQSARAYLMWENKKLFFDIQVPDGLKLYADQMRSELISYAGFNHANWLRAARICLNYKMNLEEALSWVDVSMNTERMNGKKTFEAMRTKADILTALSRVTEADAVMAEAMNTLSPTLLEVHDYGRSLLSNGRKDRALEVFLLNRQKHKEDKFITYVGLARAYTAVGNKKEAIRNWEVAIRNLPEEYKQSLDTYQAELNKLKS